MTQRIRTLPGLDLFRN